MKKMDKRKFGNTDLMVTPVCFGTWQFAQDATWGTYEEEAAIKTVHAALDSGINFFDTAEAYGADNIAERILGKALAVRDCRKDVVIATKFGKHVGEDQIKYSAEDIEAALEKSLTALQTDYVDLYQVHWSGNMKDSKETVQCLEKLVKSGKIKYYGVSNFGVEQMKEFLAAGGKPCSQQLPYNLLWRAIEYDTLPQCIEHNITIMAYSPLMQGLLTGKFSKVEDVPEGRARSRHFHHSRSPICRHGEEGAERETFDAIKELKAIAAESSVPMGAMSLAWLFQQPLVSSVITGASNDAQIRENAMAGNTVLTDDVVKKCTIATDVLKEKLGPNPDMWAKNSRYA